MLFCLNLNICFIVATIIDLTITYASVVEDNQLFSSVKILITNIYFPKLKVFYNVFQV